MYTLITIYEDGFSKSEVIDEIQQVFATAGIYAYDKECISIVAMRNETREFIIDYDRRKGE